MDFRFWKGREQKRIDKIKKLMLKIQELDPNKEEDYKKLKKYESEVMNMAGKVILKDGKLQKVAEEQKTPAKASDSEMPPVPQYPGKRGNVAPQGYEEQEEESEEETMAIPPMPVNVMRPNPPQMHPPLNTIAYQQQMAFQQQQEAARQQQMAYQQQEAAMRQHMAYQQQMALQQQQEDAIQQQMAQRQEIQPPTTVRIVKVNGAIDVSVSAENFENFIRNIKEAIDSQSSFDVGNRVINGRHIIDMIINPE